jgi:hypothetical protein
MCLTMRRLRASGLVGSGFRIKPQPAQQFLRNGTQRQSNPALAINTSLVASRTLASTATLKASKPPVNNGIEGVKFSLNGLGISPRMKVALIVIFGILGTLETVTYTRWAYLHFFTDKNKEQVQDGAREA